MIFLTVGHQMPFDRLVEAVDAWALDHLDVRICAQVGAGCYRPRAFDAVSFLSPADYRRAMTAADAIVAHAGTGTIIAAGALARPLLVMPRRAALGETRNDHQVATARHFGERGAVLVAWDETEVGARLETLEGFTGATVAGPDETLLERLRRFALGDAA